MAAYRETKDEKYYTCFRDYCERWISDNADGKGDGWHPYTISLRLTNLWICLDGFEGRVQEDQVFFLKLTDSMYAQYLHLQKKLELHLLGNHYLENLKAVMLGALYFKEPGIYAEYKSRLQEELKEQILPDGVHYERSIMYHKIVLEDVMRAAKGVKDADQLFYQELSALLQPMTDAMYSLEEGMGHTPLFNDAGDNVARSMLSLLAVLREEFSIAPVNKNAFPDAGYYCLRHQGMKILMDAGEIAPDYMPGHGHCDGLSFELSVDQHPVFVNSGTGQYQGSSAGVFSKYPGTQYSGDRRGRTVGMLGRTPGGETDQSGIRRLRCRLDPRRAGHCHRQTAEADDSGGRSESDRERSGDRISTGVSAPGTGL